jgi:hypothetical protein
MIIYPVRSAPSLLRLVGSTILMLVAAEALFAGEIDLTRAVILSPAKATAPEQKAVQLLQDEVAKRTWLHWPLVHAWPSEATAVIAICQADVLDSLTRSHLDAAARPAVPDKPESYWIHVNNPQGSAPQVIVAGRDARGVLFGVGRLLRELRLLRGSAHLAGGLDLASAPAYPVRGHQMGYRPKTNSYDGWTVPIWEQYIRDLAVFGTNAVELIPPRSDDAADSPHFPMPPMDMMVAVSKLLDDYGLDVWIWYPALDKDYADPATVEFALKEWGEVFRRLPRIDAVFVPGGDPGRTQPKVLFALLEKETQVLHRYHPKAQLWVSPQGFTSDWLNEFVGLLNYDQPAWLTGVVYGPQVRITVDELRSKIPKRYPIRLYPDITHSMRCQYPVADWDLAFALTEARETINPRPRAEAQIFHATAPSSIGFISYSEGCNDDVNKIVWSCLGWDPDMAIIDILRQYSRYLIGEPYRDDCAQGLLALERNWQGPLLTNENVYTTLQQFQAMERTASPALLQNWRFQQTLYRAYYDAYERRRLLYETELEQEALGKLADAKRIGSLGAMEEAENILARSLTQPSGMDWRLRIHQLAEALFQSIRMQLSVQLYQAIEIGRGTTLDTLDLPLNNRLWLNSRCAEIRKLDKEADRLKEIESILNWSDPGPGGYYDDLGNLTRQPHLVQTGSYAKDPAFLHSELVAFNYHPGWRMSWCRNAESLYDQPLRMQYKNLDPLAHYKLRVVYAGDNFKARLRLVANDSQEIHPYLAKPLPPQPLEFDVPPSATGQGELKLSWYQLPGAGAGGRGCQVAEVWLMKKR